jgi:hypothetical protein
MAERGGFEPPVRFYPYNGLANRPFRPLRHLSIPNQGNISARRPLCTQACSHRILTSPKVSLYNHYGNSTRRLPLDTDKHVPSNGIATLELLKALSSNWTGTRPEGGQ